MEEIKSEPKRFNKKKVLPLVILGLVAIGLVSAVGYGLFIAVSHFNVEEGIEVEYWTGTAWLPLEVSGGTFDLGTATIKAGETNSFLVRARNTASSGAVGLTLQIESVPGISHSMECIVGQSEGLNYTERTDIFYFNANGDSVWKAIQVNTIADGDLPPGSIAFNNILTRDNVLPSYEETC